MKHRIVSVFVIVIAVTTLTGWNQFLATASNGATRLAVIQDVHGNRIAVEPVNEEVWNQLVELHHSGEARWIGGSVETFLTFRPDPHYRWGFRFKSDTITVAEITAEALQSTVRNISENLDHWLGMGHSYVFAEVIEILYSD